MVKPAAAPRHAQVFRPAFVVPSGLSVSQAQVVADITAAAEHWGVSVAWMLKTANCESHFHWNSVNPRGPYIGVFQFLVSTFVANGGTAATSGTPWIRRTSPPRCSPTASPTSGPAPESRLGASNSKGDH